MISCAFKVPAHIRKYTCLIIFSFSFPDGLLAAEQQLVDETTIHQWGYTALSISPPSDYRSINDIDDKTMLKYQSIKSREPVRGMTNTYYYFSLSEECFSNVFGAMMRRLSMIVLDEKDFRLAELDGNCVRIVDTVAKFGTFREQPRIHRLFNKYLN